MLLCNDGILILDIKQYCWLIHLSITTELNRSVELLFKCDKLPPSVTKAVR